MQIRNKGLLALFDLSKQSILTIYIEKKPKNVKSEL